MRVGKTVFRLDELIFARATSIANQTVDYKIVFKTNIARRFSLEEFEALHEEIAKQSPVDYLVTPTIILSTREVVIAHHFE